MKKDNMKLAGLLLALACTSACGVGAVVAGSSAVAPASITASAETTTYTMSKVAALSRSTASVIEAYSTVDTEKPAVNSWNYKFTFVEGSGKGFLYNGEAYTGWTMKQPGTDMYIELGKEAAVGDVVIIDGTFYNADSDSNLVFTLAVEWNGEKWVDYVEYTTHNIGRVSMHANNGKANHFYLKRADGSALPFMSWDFAFALGSGVGLSVNGTPVTMGEMKSTDAGLYVTFPAVKEGDVLTISGTFRCDKQALKYVIEESSFKWNGTKWENYTDYADTATSKLTVTSGTNAKEVYLLADVDLPVADWESGFSYISGTGITVNDTMISFNNSVKSIGSNKIYINLGADANVGDVLKVGGIIRNDKHGADYVLAESEYTWDGTTWVEKATEEPEEPEVPEVVYETYELGSLKVHNISDGTNTGHVPKASQIYTSANIELPLNGWGMKFKFESGEGFKLNGNAFTPDEFISVDGRVFLNIGSANVQPGDVVTVSGTFIYEAEKVRYTIAETAFVWNGNAWENKTEYATHEVGSLLYMTKNDTNTAFYFGRADGQGYPIPEDGNNGWTAQFLVKDGVGVVLNGETVRIVKQVKYPNSMYVDLKDSIAEGGLKEGDTLTIGGTFYNTGCAIQYVVTETSFTWNGEGWSPLVVYETFNVTKIGGYITDGNLYVYSTEGDELPKERGDWDNVYTFEENSGAGMAVNGEAITTTDIKLPGDFFVAWGRTVAEGDVFTIDGTYYNEKTGFKIVFNNCKMQYKDGAWGEYVEAPVEPEEPEVEYTVVEVGAVTSYAPKSNVAGRVYFTPVNNEIAWCEGSENFLYESGEGFAIIRNGETIYTDKDHIANRNDNGDKDLYILLSEGVALQKGDMAKIGGTYYQEAYKIKYVITESVIYWNGTAWQAEAITPEQPEEPDVPTVEYTEVNLGRLLPKDSSDVERLYLKTDGENKFIDIESDYIQMTYVSGTQVLVDGVASAYSRCRAYDNQFYLKIDGTKEIGTKVTFGGVFVNEDLKIKYIIEDSDFWWNGSAWQTEEYQAPTEYVVYEIGKLGVHNNSNGMLTNVPAADAIYMKRWDNQKLPIEDSTWNAKFVLESGDGWKVNGEKAEFGALVSSNSGLYINVASANVQVGDVLTVSGTFTYAGGMAKYVIEECGFVWNGTAWEEKVEYETHEVGSLIFAKWTEGSNHIYLARADGQRYAIPQDGNGGWSAIFLAKDGVGVTLNGTPIKVGSMKMPNSMFINIGVAPKVGDVLTVGGTFYNTGSARLDNGTYTYFQAIQFVVTETSFTWNGSAWVVNETPEVPEEDPTKDFTAYNVTKVGANRDSKANVVYIYTVEGDALPKDQGGWDVVCTFKAGSGAGLKLNGETLTTTDIKLPGDMYIGLGKEAAVGDVFTIDGVFYNAEKQFKLVFNNCQVQWDGTSWTTYEGGETPDNPDTPDTPVVGTTNIGALVVHKHSSGATSNAPKANNIYMTAKNGTEFPVTDWASRFTFEAGSGVGVTVNGQAVSFSMISATKDQLYITLANEVNVGDELTIGGSFVDANGVKYVIEESTVVWNGKAWENKVVYTTYELGDMKFKSWTADKLHLYMHRVDGQAITPPEDGNNGWTETFKWKDGAGVKINGVDVSASVKIPQEFFLALYQAPVAGDILTIGGTFYSEKYGVEYIINEISLMWDGTTWIPVIEYEDCVTGELVVAESQTTADTISLVRADGGDFIVDSYDYVFTFNGASGTGIRMNGELIETRTFKTYDGQIIIDLSVSAVEGDILTIGGNFYNTAAAKQYIVEESSFIYTNGVWSVYENDYVQVGLGEVVIDAEASSEWGIYFLSKNGVALPVNSWDDEFVVAAGVGVTLNGEVLEGTFIASIDDAFYVELPQDAVEGDVLVIGGQFVCETQGALYFVKQCAFTWNGEAWEKEIQYSDVELGSVKLYGASASATGGANNALQLKAAGSIIKTEGELVLESGVGVAVNGQAVTASFKVASEGYLNVTFDGVQEGDEVTIGGSFLWKEQEVRYVIDETTFVWTGSWAIKCEKFNVGTFVISSVGTNAQDLYLAPSDYTVQLPVRDWEAPFTYVSGTGITVNGTQINMTNNVKSVDVATMFIRLTADASGVAEGSIVKIGGVFRCDMYAYEYIIEDCAFIYQGGTWINMLDSQKAEAAAELDAYLLTFVETDYNESEWSFMTQTVAYAKAEIISALSAKAVAEIVAETKATLDSVVTKATWDAEAETIKAAAKEEVAGYKNAAEYRADDQAVIAAAVSTAQAAIDAATNWTEVYVAVENAKAAMDALWTDAEWTAAEAVVANAKAQLTSYKVQDNYYADEWAQIQAIITQANIDIDFAIGNTKVIGNIVENAKAAMDAVKTSTQVDAEEAVVSAAKDELNNYKVEGDYNAPEWEAIQNIIIAAYAQIDAAIGDSDAIARIVTEAKAKMDKVLKSEEADAKAFEDAKAEATATVREIANSINYDLYTEENAGVINGYLTEAMTKIKAVTDKDGFAAIVEELKAKIDAVEKIETSADDKKVGCGSVVGMATGLTLAAGVAAMALRRKKDEE